MKIKGLLLATLSLACQYAFAQNDSAFQIVPKRSNPGDLIKIVYDSKGTVLEGKKNISAVVYVFENYKWVAQDLSLKDSSGVWRSSYKVPEKAGIIALKFLSDTLVDNNHDQGYFTMFLDKGKPGMNAAGGYAGWGMARSPKYGLDIPGYLKFKGITDTASYYWVSQEIAFHPEAKGLLGYTYALAAKNAFNNQGLVKAQAVVAYNLRSDAPESEMLNARKIYINLLGDQKRADSIATVILKKYPSGSLARVTAFKALSLGSDIAVSREAYQRFLTAFPKAGPDRAFEEENRLSYPVIYQNYVILSNYLDKNTSSLDQYLGEMDFNVLPNLYYKMVDIPFSRKEVSEKSLLLLSDKLIKRVEALRAIRPENFMYLSPKEWSAYIDKNIATHILPVHIHLLNTAGRYKEALSYVQAAKAQLGYKNATLNAEMVSTYSHLKQDAPLGTVLEKSVFENQSSPEMMNMLKLRYIKAHKSEKGYDDYLKSLMNKNSREKLNNELKAQIVSKPMVDFEMKDLAGKSVRLSDLKGKTVVFDFWATWCVPCKASFPGMKLAVQRYAKDKNVVFYFVDTEERGENYKTEVAKYLKDNDYQFNVLFDNQTKDGKSTGEVFDRICKAFSISGIPQKIVVDGSGNARFLSVGFKGSATELADEISAMVELTQKAQ